MDFSYLLELAQSNDKTNKKEASKKKFSTNLSTPKKVEKSAVNTDAIKRRLEEKEEKKKIELKAFNAKKEKLLELRSHDKKANKRVNAMINMSKGACKSVLDDVKNLSTDKAEPQCDADDYGYESAMSMQIFAKLADTYKEIPDDERLKFKKTGAKSMADIKSRVMNSLKRQEEEELIPGRRKRKTKRKVDQDDFLNDGDPYDNIGPQTASVGSKEVIKERERNEKLGITSPSKKHRHKMPVNVNLTFTKSDKTSAFKYQDKPRDKSKDREKKQEREKERNRDRDRERDREKKRDREDSGKPKDDDKPKSFKIPKKKKPNSENDNNKMPPPMSFQELLKIANQKKGKALADPKAKILEVKEKKKEEKKKRDSERPMTAEEKEVYEDEQNRRNKKMGIKEDSGRLREALEKKSDSKSQSKNESRNEQKAKSKQPEPKPEPPPPPPKPDRSKYFATPASKKTQPPPELPKKNKDKDRPRDLPPKVSSKEPPRKSSKDYSSRDSSSKDSSKSRDTSRLFPPSDVRRKPTSITNGRNRIESDEDSEYDSEMDDFIDDGAEEMDYRSEIAKMFKIDRDKWRRIDAEDVDDMEVGYSQLEREESRSAQIGLMEDMEDMKAEERYRKQKLARKKMSGKSR